VLNALHVLVRLRMLRVDIVLQLDRVCPLGHVNRARSCRRLARHVPQDDRVVGHRRRLLLKSILSELQTDKSQKVIMARVRLPGSALLCAGLWSSCAPRGPRPLLRPVATRSGHTPATRTRRVFLVVGACENSGRKYIATKRGGPLFSTSGFQAGPVRRSAPEPSRGPHFRGGGFLGDLG
jgi:hypothetical protein